MQKFFRDKHTLEKCHIYQMLKNAAKERHFSFHTPGHKVGEWDITELSFSDNLADPTGCIQRAEEDIAYILGAERSFIMTDGSTSGVLSMLYAAKLLRIKEIAVPINAHKSVFNGCKMLGITPIIFDNEAPMSEVKYIFDQVHAVFVTSPDYYGRIPDYLAELRAYCDKRSKILLIDGAHGGHLHFDRERYAGNYADLWVDGVHKSLPALTQGAVVSARTPKLAEKLKRAVDVFRTTSPSYPIMASVEYAVKYPRNHRLEQAVWKKQEHPRVVKNDDWTKLCVLFGEHAYEAQEALERKGYYLEFCDGNILTFYLSPVQCEGRLISLFGELEPLFEQYPYTPIEVREQRHAPLVLPEKVKTEWVKLSKSEGRICAANCGLFPPCSPLILAGERINKEQIETLSKAKKTFGIYRKNILVVKEEK